MATHSHSPHSHSHDHAALESGASHGALAARSLGLTLLIQLICFGVEAVGGYWSHSLSLLADAGHLLTDVASLLISWLALRIARWPANHRFTFGYEGIELLAALLNALLLVGIAAGFVLSAMVKWQHPASVETNVMTISAAIGLLGNLLGVAILMRHTGELNIRAAWWHLLSDTLSSVVVLVGGGLIRLTGQMWIDPLLCFVIALIIGNGALSMLRQVIPQLLSAAPSHLSTEEIRAHIEAIEGVVNVHALHVWRLREDYVSMHVVAQPKSNRDQLLSAIQAGLAQDFQLTKSTIQIESDAQGHLCVG